MGQPALPNEYQLFRLVPAQRQREYLAGRFATIWDHHGFPNIDYHWASCAAYSVTQRGVLRKSLLFVRIRSAASDVADGQLHYVNVDDDNLILRLWGRLPELTRVNALRTLSHSVLAIRLALAHAPAAPAMLPHVPAPPEMRSAIKTLAPGQREIDDSLLEHACVEPGNYYTPDETNPDEMSDGEEESREEVMEEMTFKEKGKEHIDEEELLKTPESPCSWIEVDAAELPSVNNDINGWAIYASDLSAEEILAKGVKNFERLSGGVLDDFVMDLHCHVLWVKNKLPAEPETGSQTPLMEDDEWRCWFYDVLNAKAVSVINAAGGKIGGFRVQASLSLMGKGPTENTPAWMNFSTDEAILKTAFGSTNPVLPTGLLKRHCMLVMGLETVRVEPSKTVYLHNLVDFIGVEELKEKNTLIKVLGAFPMKPPSTHEELQGKRNAVWFLPSNDYRTTIRLEWPMDPTTQEELNKFLKPLNLTLGTTSAIARRSSRWSTTGPSCQMLTQGSLVFHTEITINQIKLEATFEFSTTVTTLTLTLNSKTSQALESILNWVKGLVPGDEKFDFGDLQGQSFGSSSLGEFHFRRITIGLIEDQSGRAKLSTFSMDMEAGLHHSPKPSTLFLITYTYQKGQGSTVNAKLWCCSYLPTPMARVVNQP